MFSRRCGRRAIGILVFLLSFVFQLGCSREQQPASPPILIRLKNVGDCLGEFRINLDKFADGKMSDGDVVEFWSCVGRAVDDFRTITKGESPIGDYTPEAIRRFVEQHFVKRKIVSDHLLRGLMELKRVVLGGSSEVITSGEVERLNQFLKELQRYSLILRPHIRVLLLHDKEVSAEQLTSATAALETVMHELGLWLGSRAEPFSFAQAFDLIDSVTEGQSVKSTWLKWSSLLEPLKQILIGGSANGIAASEWPALTQSVFAAYSIFVVYHYRARPDVIAGIGSRELPVALLSLGECLRGSLSRQGTGEIPASVFNRLFFGLEAVGFLPSSLNAKEVSGLWQYVLQRLLLARAPVEQELGFSSRALGRLRHWLVVWSNPLNDPEFQVLLGGPTPLQWTSDGRLTLTSSDSKDWSSDDPAHLALPFVLLRAVRDSFFGQGKVVLTEADLIAIVSEVLPRVQVLGWLKTAQPTIAKRFLREMDLFTIKSNGDGVLDLGEGTRYIEFLLSAWRSANLWLEESKAACPSGESECVRRWPAQRDATVLSVLPGLRESAPGFEAFQLYARQAEETVLGQVITSKYTAGDLLQTWMLFQYIETFYVRFDLDRSQALDVEESLVAFAVYGGTLGRLLSPTGLPQEDVQAFFTFMMRYGDTPFTMFGGGLAFNHWKWHRSSWAFQAKRPIVMAILNQLSKL